MRLAPERRMAILTLAGMAALVAAVCVAKPGNTPWLPPCVFHELTGFYCPGCGSTRMLYLLVHGHPLLALQQNALTLMVLPVAIFMLVRQLAPARETRRPRPHLGAALFAVVVAFTIARNIPVQPMCGLAPGGVCSGGGLIRAHAHWHATSGS